MIWTWWKIQLRKQSLLLVCLMLIKKSLKLQLDLIACLSRKEGEGLTSCKTP